jgi:protein tyrosine phosphatase (PTP) superfamily phosphohydrolase (DUF442 family)
MLRHCAILGVLVCVLSACGSDPPTAPGFRRTPFTPGNADPSVGGGGGGGGSASCAPNQSVLVGAVINARDLGGTPLKAGGQVACGQIFRGPPLAPLSEQACADFRGLGIRTVIDLRTPDEVVGKPDADCVAEAAKLVFTPLPIPYNVSPENYLADLNAPTFAQALRVLGDEAAYPVYFHCTWGRDRTGVLGAVILLALGATRDTVLAEYMLSAPLVNAFPNSLVAVLDDIERRGGIEAFLSAAGMSADQRATLRARAIAPK